QNRKQLPRSAPSARRSPASTARSKSPARHATLPTTTFRTCSMPCRSARRSPKATSRPRQMPGVRAILRRGDLAPIAHITPDFGNSLMVDEPRPPFDDDVVRYYGQYVALAVADTFEQAKAAADAVAVSCAAETPNVDPHLVAKDTKVASERGDAEKA